ncbi:MAG: hypothetical protein M3P43_14645 [Actinomycetota bacterium]|nr:hypothetical protein [Actinomycetota bacterium]
MAGTMLAAQTILEAVAKTTCATSSTDPTGAATTAACDAAGDVTSVAQIIRAITGLYANQALQTRTT